MPRSRAAAVRVSSVPSGSAVGSGAASAPVSSYVGLPAGGSLTRARMVLRSSCVRRGLRPLPGFIPKPLQAALVEGMQALAYRLRVAAELLGNLAGAQPVPAVGHDLGVHDPIGGRMGTVDQLAHVPFSERIEGGTSGKMFGHRRPPSPHLPADLGPVLRNDANSLF